MMMLSPISDLELQDVTKDFVLMQIKDTNAISLSASELSYVRMLAATNPTSCHFKKDMYLTKDVYRFRDSLAIISNELGQGFWGAAYKGLMYPLQQPTAQENESGNPCVIKKEKSANFAGKWLNAIFDLKAKMADEAKLAKAVFGLGETITIQEGNEPIALVLIPFLGKMTLSKLIQDKFLITHIEMSEWLRLFEMLSIKLDFIHTNGVIHNDIKPDNIVISFGYIKGHYQFTAFEFIDFGNAQKPGESGWFGDPGYQPMEALTCLPQFKTPKIDIYALGLSLNDVLQSLKSVPRSNTDLTLIDLCERITKQMAQFNPDQRPVLNNVSTQFSEINTKILNLAPIQAPRPIFQP
jgi:serine/threonine protein kinase